MSASSETPRATHFTSTESAELSADSLSTASDSRLPVEGRHDRPTHGNAMTHVNAMTSRQTSSGCDVEKPIDASPVALDCGVLAVQQVHPLDEHEASRCWVVQNHGPRPSGTPVPAGSLKRLRMEALPSQRTSSERASSERTTSERNASERTSMTPEDREIGELIRAKLKQKLNRRARHIKCHVASGHVTLYGIVRCFYEMQLAQESALRTRGVQSVVNLIDVEGEEGRD